MNYPVITTHRQRIKTVSSEELQEFRKFLKVVQSTSIIKDFFTVLSSKTEIK